MGLGLGQSDHIIQMITLSVITLSGFHCTTFIFYFLGKNTKCSQTYLQRPPLKPPKSGHCSESGSCSEADPKY